MAKINGLKHNEFGYWKPQGKLWRGIPPEEYITYIKIAISFIIHTRRFLRAKWDY